LRSGVRLTCADQDGDSTKEGKQSHICGTVQHSLKLDSILSIWLRPDGIGSPIPFKKPNLPPERV
jgi:hypothetical protein